MDGEPLLLTSTARRLCPGSPWPQDAERPGVDGRVRRCVQLFTGFGENWPALTECLSYLDEWLPADAYVLVVERADELLADDEADVPALLRALDGAGRFWSEPVIDSGRFDRPARPFHALLMVPESNGAVVQRMRTAASSIDVAFD